MTKNVSLEFLAFFDEFLPTKNVNVARFARNIEWDIFHDFQTMWFIPHTSPVTIPQTPRAHTHMLSQKPSSCLLVAVLPGRKSKSGVQPIINSSRWGSFSIFYDTNGEREAVPLYLRKRECWQKLKKLFYVESKKIHSFAHVWKPSWFFWYRCQMQWWNKSKLTKGDQMDWFTDIIFPILFIRSFSVYLEKASFKGGGPW